MIMGSGSSSSYSGTNGGSQEYAETYRVVPKMLNKDKKDSDIYNSNTGYFKNPTATNLLEAIKNNRFYIQGIKAENKFTYVLDENGNIIFGKRCNPNNSNKRSPHPTLIGGKNPKVQCAGIIEFKDGKIYYADNNSGHFRPNIKSLDKVKAILDKLYESNSKLFYKNSEWRKKK